MWCCAWKRATIGSVYQCRYWRTLDHQMASYRVQRNHNGRRDWNLSYLSKACFCFSWFSPQAIQSPAAVSVFSVVDLFIGLVGFCEAMKAAQFDTSSGNVSIWCEKVEQKVISAVCSSSSLLSEDSALIDQWVCQNWRSERKQSLNHLQIPPM